MASEVATRSPAFVDGKAQSANELRLNVLSGSGGATPLQSRAGVRPSGGNPGLVSALPTPVMKVRVNAGIADVPSSSVTGGFYRVSWDQADLDIDPSSAQARTDLIIVEVVDTGTAAATGKVRVLKGTSGAGRPTNGVVNAHWFSLAATAVRVNAEGTGNIRPQDVTPELQYAVAPGADLPVSSQAERDALPTWPLRTVKRLDTGNIEMRNPANTSWVTVFDAAPAATPYLFAVLAGAGSSLNNAAWEDVPFDQDDTDTNGWHSTATYPANAMCTVDRTGWFFVQAGIAWGASPTGIRGVRMIKNGTPGVAGLTGTLVRGSGLVLPSAGAGVITSTVTPQRRIFLNAGDTLKVQGFQSSGAALGLRNVLVGSDDQVCFLEVRFDRA